MLWDYEISNQKQSTTLECSCRNFAKTRSGGAILNDPDVKHLLQYQDEKKSLAATYLLWGFVGAFGGHRFYLGKKGTAVAMLALTLTIVGIVVTFIWWIVDAILIPDYVKELNREILAEIIGGDSLGAT